MAPLIHAAKIHPQGRSPRYLLLRETGDATLSWFEEHEDGTEAATPVTANTIAEAMRLARRHWSDDAFRTVHCGFAYSGPNRDEHGRNCLFHEMIQGLRSPSGSYFDPTHQCQITIQFASQEAIDLWQRLEAAERLT